MRKQVIAQEARDERTVEGSFLNLEALARVEITSEDPAHPIESALVVSFMGAALIMLFSVSGAAAYWLRGAGWSSGPAAARVHAPGRPR